MGPAQATRVAPPGGAVRSRVDEFGHSGFVQPTGTETTAHAPLAVGASLRSAEIGAPHTAHNCAFATIRSSPSDL